MSDEDATAKFAMTDVPEEESEKSELEEDGNSRLLAFVSVDVDLRVLFLLDFILEGPTKRVAVEDELFLLLSLVSRG